MAFDYKKEYKEFYMPKGEPSIVKLDRINYIAVRGKGDPNQEDGEYKKAIGLLYAIAFTVKMSYKGSYKIDGYFDYVVPPLEGLWYTQDGEKFTCADKQKLCWISMIRLPDFVKKCDFDWAIEQATAKKNIDFSLVEYFEYDEGLCAQCMHIGSYDDEPMTIDKIESFALSQGYEPYFGDGRMHHEIYLSDPRKVSPDKLKTVIRIPIAKK
ncbi:MAG: GyrI-like domain-containing protein [Clostridia bacterium]|nr:GyrI-like domain-containing protein [Clostridia bacterium]